MLVENFFASGEAFVKMQFRDLSRSIISANDFFCRRSQMKMELVTERDAAEHLPWSDRRHKDGEARRCQIDESL